MFPEKNKKILNAFVIKQTKTTETHTMCLKINVYKKVNIYPLTTKSQMFFFNLSSEGGK